uniref:HAT C-terminal dimerisation domain-containing protein n=1 Tax=Latimeria chalumnae TaxID=7897 RepID=H2ZX01_LATCH
CELCRMDFSVSHGGYNDVTRHLATEKHKSNAKAVEKTSSVMKRFQPTKQTNSVISVEGFVIEHNLPLTINDHFSKLVSRMFPNSDIARQYSCGRIKSTHLAYGIPSDLIDTVKQEVATPKLMFSLATNGNSDEKDKFCPVLIFHEDKNGLVTTSFFDMPVINLAGGENIGDVLKQSLRDVGLDLQQCLSFSSDNASVMTGRPKGVLSVLHKENKEIYGMGCPCHLSTLAAKEGSKALKSFDPEDFMKDLFYHFDTSAKRKHLLRELLVFCDVEVHKVLKHVTTRWLSLHKCLEGSLNLWDGLRSYFLTHFEMKGGPRKQRLVTVFKDPTTQLYIHFLHAMLPSFDSFNTLLQTEAPIIHRLYPSMIKLYRSILSCVVLPTAIQNEDSIMKVDFENPDLQKSDKEFIGFAAMQLIRKNDLEGTSGVDKFRRETLNYIRKKFPVDDKLIQNAVLVNPATRQTASLQSLLELVQQLPEDVIPVSSRDALFMEFCNYQSASMSDLPAVDQGERVDAFWTAMEQLKDPTTGQKLYPTLCRLAKHVLLIPHSKTLFSMVRKVTSDMRSQLGRGKNTLCGLLASKINIFKKEGSTRHNWKPSDDFLKKAKSATKAARLDVTPTAA